MSNSVIILDGVPLELTPVEKDNKISFQTQVTRDTGIQSISQPTELGESLRELNKDDLDLNSRMSDIDMRARLYPIEISSILAMDSLVSLGICPSKALSFTRQKKRLSVSLFGSGRKEIVSVVAGKRELEEKGASSLWDKFKGGFSSGQNQIQ